MARTLSNIKSWILAVFDFVWKLEYRGWGPYSQDSYSVYSMKSSFCFSRNGIILAYIEFIYRSFSLRIMIDYYSEVCLDFRIPESEMCMYVGLSPTWIVIRRGIKVVLLHS